MTGAVIVTPMGPIAPLLTTGLRVFFGYSSFSAPYARLSLISASQACQTAVVIFANTGSVAVININHLYE